MSVFEIARNLVVAQEERDRHEPSSPLWREADAVVVDWFRRLNAAGAA